MPYINEHAARIKAPDKKAKYWSNKLDNHMRAIMMDGSVQSIRFDVNYWTATEAKAWLKKTGWNVLKFEPAKEPKVAKLRRNPEMAIYKDNGHLKNEVLETIHDKLLEMQGDMKRAVKQAGINIGLARRYYKEIDKYVYTLDSVIADKMRDN